jgi:RNA polymerase sigma-70 factor, ECF subfamily
VHPDDLFATLAPELRGYCRRFFADPSLADDAVQQTFEIALRSLPSLRDPERARAWMYSIARHECLRLLKQHASTPLSDDEPDSSLPSPEAQAITSDIITTIEHALEALPPIYRQAVVLRDMEGLSYADITEATGASLASVKFRIFKGRELLMGKLGAVLKEWRTP